MISLSDSEHRKLRGKDTRFVRAIEIIEEERNKVRREVPHVIYMLLKALLMNDDQSPVASFHSEATISALLTRQVHYSPACYSHMIYHIFPK